jgi:hypothetical protein
METLYALAESLGTDAEADESAIAAADGMQREEM